MAKTSLDSNFSTADHTADGNDGEYESSEEDSEYESDDDDVSEDEAVPVPSVVVESPSAGTITYGTATSSLYTTVVLTGTVHEELIFPLKHAGDYTIVEHLIEHSPKRKTIKRARAVTVASSRGGVVHHVIETFVDEEKAINMLYSTKGETQATVDARVLTKNTARLAIAADKKPLGWDIEASTTRPSYKKLMMLGFGKTPRMIFATFFASHLLEPPLPIPTTVKRPAESDEPSQKRRKRPKTTSAPTTITPPSPTMSPVLTQNMVWVAELEATLARAPDGIEKKIVRAAMCFLSSL